ncbi:MAG TPA: hypothetical protein PJ991_10330 [Kiritimatiellia bacterium]|nr:hypothetical protein [Kiritimatiellia bacterium]
MTNPSSRKHEEGIALVVVLGILSLLIILGFGFSVAMRTERMAASSAADTIRARHLLQVALARAMEDISTDMLAGGLVYPPSFMQSGDFNETDRLAFGPTDLFSGEFTNYVPRGMHVDVRANSSPRWVNILDPDDSSHRLGRYSFLAVDSSGLLDINVVHNPDIQRLRGTNGMEIRINRVAPEFTGDASIFLAERSNTWVRFESIPDIMATARRQNAISAVPQNFMSFSRFPPDVKAAASPTAPDKIFIGGNDASLLSNQGPIITALENAGIDNASEVFDALVDFIDPDIIPRNLNSFNTEPVPMINEIAFSGRYQTSVDGSDITYTLQIRVEVELWFPFPFEVARTFTLSASPDFDFLIPDSFAALPPGTRALMEDLYQNLDPFSGNPTLSGNADVNQTGMYVLQYDYPPRTYTMSGLPNFPALPIDLQVKQIDVEYSGTAVDRVSELPKVRLQLVNGQAYANRSGMECLDPRLNHDPQYWLFATGPAVTIGNINQATRNFAGGEPPFDGNAGTLANNSVLMYVRNFPLNTEKPGGFGLGSVADLGFISIGKPWQTIALYQAPPDGRFHKVMDYFTTDNNPEVQRGKVNINSPNVNVLAAPFYQTPIQAYPSGPTSGTLGWNEAMILANKIFNDTNVEYYTNMSQYARMSAAQFKSAMPSGFTVYDGHIESVIANSYNLFGFRQNIFTTVVAAQVVRPSPEGDVVTAEQRAVVVFWRDPMPNQDDRNVCYVQFYKLLVD